MLTYSFENIDTTLYEHIYKCIKEDIINGNIKRGERLPSKRAFAKNNGVSRITIENAYDQLISEGYIYSIPRKGYFVSDSLKVHPRRVAREDHEEFIIPDKSESYDIDFSGNNMQASGFPFSVWARLMREVLSEKRELLMKPSPTGGISELREAIAGHLRSFRGMNVSPSQIIIGAGTEYLYGLIIQLLGNDKVYCIENPGYNKIPMIYSKHGVSYKYADMDDKGIIPEEIERNSAKIAHISAAHHFPTGITMPASRRYEVIAWANEEEGRYIIEDDYDSEFRNSGKPIPPLFAMDESDRTIYINTFSNSLASTIRISYMVLPVHLIKKFYDELSFYSCTVSIFEQYTLAKFIEKGFFEKHINRRRIHYSKQREKILSAIYESSLSNKCRIIENDSGLHFLIRLDTDISDEELIRRLHKKNINIKALSEFYSKEKEEDKHIFLVNYSNINEMKLKKGLDAIYRAMDLASI